MTKNPKSGAATGSPVKYLKMMAPVEILTEKQWLERMVEEVALIKKSDDCRQLLLDRNGGSVPIDNLDGDLWTILTKVSEEADARVHVIIEGFDWPMRREEETIVGGRKQ